MTPRASSSASARRDLAARVGDRQLQDAGGAERPERDEPLADLDGIAAGDPEPLERAAHLGRAGRDGLGGIRDRGRLRLGRGVLGVDHEPRGGGVGGDVVAVGGHGDRGPEQDARKDQTPVLAEDAADGVVELHARSTRRPPRSFRGTSETQLRAG